MFDYVDLGKAAQRLRDNPEIREVAAVRSSDGRLYVLLEVPGFLYGPLLRDIVFDELESEYADLAAVWVRAIPRTSDGAVDQVESIALAEQVVENPRWVFAMEPAATDQEKAIAELLTDILKPKRLSMTDSLTMLGADSLVLVEIQAVIAERFGITLNPNDLFATNDIREIVKLAFGSESTIPT